MLSLRAVLADERGFIHKRIFGGIKGAVGGLISGGSPISGAIGGFVRGGRGQDPRIRRVQRPQVNVAALVPSRAQAKCPPGFFETPAGGCQAVASPTPKRTSAIPGGVADILISALPDPVETLVRRLSRDDPQFNGELVAGDAFGEARMGRFGAGLEPSARSSVSLSCPPGAVLGKQEADGSFLCYNKRDLSNKERKWPRGRRPLLTGGEMRCISVASRAAKSLQRKQKQLEGLGLLKRPSRSRPKAPAGHVAVVKHA